MYALLNEKKIKRAHKKCFIIQSLGKLEWNVYKRNEYKQILWLIGIFFDSVRDREDGVILKMNLLNL